MKWLDEATKTLKTVKTRPEELKHGRNPTENRAGTRPAGDGKIPTATKTPENNTSKQQHDPSAAAAENVDAFHLLIDAGFDKATARELSEGRRLDEVRQQIEWLDERNPRDNRLGMLRKAIDQNWAKPVSVEQAEKRLRRAEDARQQDRQAEIDEAKAAEAKRERKRHREAALIIFNSLTADERSATESATFEQLNSDFFRRQFRTDEQFRIQQCLDEICRREGIIPVTSPVT